MMTIPTSCKFYSRSMHGATRKSVSLIFPAKFCFVRFAANIHPGKNASISKRVLLEQAFRDGVPYVKMCDSVKDTVVFALFDQQTTLLQNVQDVFDSVVKDFDEMFVVEEIPDPKRNALCQQIQEFVVEANAILNGPIESEFAAATSLSAPPLQKD